MSLVNLSAAQLRRAAGIKDQIQSLENQLAKLLGSTTPATPTNGRKKKRKMSAAAKAKISAAAKARWAKVKKAGKKKL